MKNLSYGGVYDLAVEQVTTVQKTTPKLKKILDIAQPGGEATYLMRYCVEVRQDT